MGTMKDKVSIVLKIIIIICFIIFMAINIVDADYFNVLMWGIICILNVIALILSVKKSN